MAKWLASVLIFAAVSSWAQAPAGNGNAPMAVPTDAKAASTAKSTVTVEKIVVAAGVENREATGEATIFGADVGKVYCWTKLSVSEPPAKIKYVWSLNGKQLYEHQLDIKSSGRWWTAKTVEAGSWKVEVQSDSGESLGSVGFSVGGQSKAAAPAPVTK